MNYTRSMFEWVRTRKRTETEEGECVHFSRLFSRVLIFHQLLVLSSIVVVVVVVLSVFAYSFHIISLKSREKRERKSYLTK